jgi:glycosyltransferase involved in cell wall biosynthesis
MNIGVILPHSKLYGGVKRFFELGNLFVADGHNFIVFNENGDLPDWFSFNGRITTITEISNYSLDVLFFTEPAYYSLVKKANAVRKIFYFVKGRENLRQIIRDHSIEIFTNSTNLYLECSKRYGIKPFKAFGGIDTEMYKPGADEMRNPEEPFVVLAFGRLSKKRKGTRYIIKACERVYSKHKNIKLILFDTPTDDKAKRAIEEFKCKVPFEFFVNHPYDRNPELFHKAHVYVSAEYKTGYSNTSAEAMACRVAVIGTKSGTREFLFNETTGLIVKRNSFSIARAIKKLMFDEPLRIKLASAGRKKIEEFSWSNLYNVLLAELTNKQNKVITD